MCRIEVQLLLHMTGNGLKKSSTVCELVFEQMQMFCNILHQYIIACFSLTFIQLYNT